MTLANNVLAKFAVAFVAFAMMLSVAAPASAQGVDDMSLEELISLVTQLQAQLGGDDDTSGGSSSDVCPYTWTRSLNMGDTGADVMKLQKFLNSMPETMVAATGAGSAGSETEYYGPATGAAVSNFQMKYRAEILSPLGLVNPTTFFGNSTRAQANALCVADMTDGGDDSDDSDDSDDDNGSSASLGNDEGEIDSYDQVSADENSINEGEVAGVTAVELEITGDVEINRVDVFATDSGSGSDKSDDYFEGASLWVDGEKVAELDEADFDDDGYVTTGAGTDNYDYRLRFSGLGLVFEDGDEPEFQVAFETIGKMDSADLASNWDVEIESIRYVDGEGFTDTEEDMDIEENFDFEAEETAELDISESSDNPDSTTLKIDDADDESEEFDVFVFEIEEENGVDVTIEDMTVTILTTGSTTEGDVVDEAILYHGSTELASESVNGAGSPGVDITFENLGIEIAGDATEEFTVALIFNGVDDHGNASDVTVDFKSIDDAEDENGNDEGEMAIDGDAGATASETHTLRTVVPEVTDTSFSTDKAEDDASGVISFEFTIGAEDDDFDFAVATKSDVDGTSDDIRFTTSGASTTLGVASITKVSGDATSTGAGWTIADGDEATFVMDVQFTTASGADDGTYRVTVDTVGGIEIDDTSDGMSIAN